MKLGLAHLGKNMGWEWVAKEDFWTSEGAGDEKLHDLFLLYSRVVK